MNRRFPSRLRSNRSPAARPTRWWRRCRTHRRRAEAARAVCRPPASDDRERFDGRLAEAEASGGPWYDVTSSYRTRARTGSWRFRDEAGWPLRVVERKDDAPAERTGQAEINSGMLVVDAAFAREALSEIAPSPVSGEYYLPELIELAVARASDGES